MQLRSKNRIIKSLRKTLISHHPKKLWEIFQLTELENVDSFQVVFDHIIFNNIAVSTIKSITIIGDVFKNKELRIYPLRGEHKIEISIKNNKFYFMDTFNYSQQKIEEKYGNLFDIDILKKEIKQQAKQNIIDLYFGKNFLPADDQDKIRFMLFLILLEAKNLPNKLTFTRKIEDLLGK